MLAIFGVSAAGAPTAPTIPSDLTPTLEIAPGVNMPRVSVGTCCGSDTTGVPAWLDAGGTGIDTAYDYGKTCPGGKQTDLAKILDSRSGLKRGDIFLTTKIPAGLGVTPKVRAPT